jgi:hypothetical protein
LLQMVHKYQTFPVRNPGSCDRDHFIQISFWLWIPAQVTPTSGWFLQPPPPPEECGHTPDSLDHTTHCWLKATYWGNLQLLGVLQRGRLYSCFYHYHKRNWNNG